MTKDSNLTQNDDAINAFVTGFLLTTRPLYMST